MAFRNLLNLAMYEELNEAVAVHDTNVQRRWLRDSSNPFQLPEANFRKCFRLSKDLTRHIVESLRPHFPKQRRSTGVPLELRVIAVLQFFSRGSYQEDAAGKIYVPLEQSTFSRILIEVTDGIVDHLLPIWVTFPQTVSQFNHIKQGFLQHGLGGIIGAIDCTHVAIISPAAEDPVRPARAYYNRKGYYSLNVQTICDTNLRIMNCNARFPRANHDSAIWELSSVRQVLQQRFVAGDLNHSWLIGDSGYPLQPWLTTPVINAAENSPEARSNVAHVRARICIERCFGLLKQRFRCLLKHRVLHYSPVRAAKIIYSCMVLHNMLIDARVPNINVEDVQDAPIEEPPDDENDDGAGGDQDWLGQGRRVRNRLIRQHF